MSKTPHSAVRSGFTLIEMMVAVGLAVLITTMVAVAFRQGWEVWAQTYLKIEAMHNAQVALDYLETDLRGAYLEVGQLFLGIEDNSKGTIDNDGGGVGAADSPALLPPAVAPEHYKPFHPIAWDPVDFDLKDTDTRGQERQGLEFLSSSLYAVDTDTGESVGGVHVLYYVTRDCQTKRDGPSGKFEIGRLIRHTEPRDSTPLTSHWLGAPTPDINEEGETLVYGITQLKFRYYYNGDWYDGWDSTDLFGWDGVDDGGTGDDVQFRRLPQVVEVTMRVLDVNGKLDAEEARNPFVISRLIRLSASTD